MKYSLNWIQSHIDAPLPSVESLKETIIFHAFEVENIETMNGDSVMDIKVLPDRAGDCLSHYGMAREIAGLLKLPLKSLSYKELPEIKLAIPVEIKSEQCLRYTAVQIDNVKIGPSPEWLIQRLESVGQRTINNVVDATNFVLLDLGQPTHAFDRTKIDGGIVIRLAHDGESMITLSDEPKQLTEDMLVIADYVGALAIAGVKGGKTAEVEEVTTSVVLEIANFDATTTRRTARALNLQTDAVKRFENNISPALVQVSARALVSLILDIAGGEVVGVTDIYPKLPETKIVSFTTSDITRVLGGTITHYNIEDVFEQYQYVYTKEGDNFTLTVPAWRADIIGAHDIAEEIGRVVGYNALPSPTLPFGVTVAPNDTFVMTQKVRQYLSSHGFNEVMTYTFRPKGDVEVARGPKGKSMLRTNLSEGLKDSYEMNRLNAPLVGLSVIKLFEIGTVFATDSEEIRVATVENGSFQEQSLTDFYVAHEKDLTTTESSSELKVLDRFKYWSAYPFVVRDIAVWTPDEKKVNLETIVQDFAKEHCVRSAYIFDTFSKEGRTSVAYRFVFQAQDKTLTTEEVDAVFSTLAEKIKAEEGFEIR